MSAPNTTPSQTTSTDDDVFGDAGTESEFNGFKYLKPKSPDKGQEKSVLVVRLFPPMKSLKADLVGWRRFYGSHFGAVGVSKNPDKPRQRPHACIEKKDHKTKQIVSRCPKCDQRQTRLGQQRRREEQILAQHPEIARIEVEAERHAALMEVCKKDSQWTNLQTWLRKHNLDKKFWLNAMKDDGTFGVLQLRFKTFKKLETKIKEWREKGINIFDPKGGAWLRITTTGYALQVNDELDLVTEREEINGKTYEAVKPAPLTREQILQAQKICPDLSLCVPQLSYGQIEALIAADGDPQKTDFVFDGPPKETSNTVSGKTADDYLGSDEEEGDDPETETGSATTQTQTQTQTTPVTVTTPPVDLDAEEAALEAQMRAIRERKKKTATATPPPSDPNEDFVRDFVPRKA